jgi:hypothetical protein
MNREKALKVALVVVGLLFVALTYPLLTEREDSTLQMMLSLYVTMGVFLLIASRNPSAHRSLIAFAAWSNLAHAGTMVIQSLGHTHERTHLLLGVAVFGTVGLILLALSPAKASPQMATAAS